MRRSTGWRRTKLALATLLAGGIPLVTVASCDPRTGSFDFYRNRGHDDYVYWDYGYDDCWYDCGYGFDDYFYFDW